MKKAIVIFCLLFPSIICFSQTNEKPNRQAFTLKLAVNDTNYYQDEIKESSYILPENTLQMYPGETLFVEVEAKNNEILSMKTVKEKINPNKTLTISFIQKFEGKTHEMMMLNIENPLNKKIMYKAWIYLMIYKKWDQTSVIPIKPKLSGFEIWPDIISSIALTGWELSDD